MIFSSLRFSELLTKYDPVYFLQMRLNEVKFVPNPFMQYPEPQF